MDELNNNQVPAASEAPVFPAEQTQSIYMAQPAALVEPTVPVRQPAESAQPVYAQPVYVQPVYERPADTVAPGAPAVPVQPAAPAQPVYAQPVYQQPAASVQPAYQQSVYQQPVYQQGGVPVVTPVAPAEPSEEASSLASSSMTMGILGLALSELPVAGIILSILSMIKRSKATEAGYVGGKLIPAKICSIIGLATSIFFNFYWMIIILVIMVEGL